MPSASGATTSTWLDSVHPPHYPPLRGTIRTDICIVGAGVAGLTTAYLLTRAGRTVTMIDTGAIGGGETSRSTAHLTAALDQGYSTVAELHGQEYANIAAESHTSAIGQIETIVQREQIDCDFERVSGYLFPTTPENHDDRDVIFKELRATHAVGLTDTQIAPVPIPGIDLGMALCYPNQAQFHPLKYLTGLVRAVVRQGGKIYCGTRAVEARDGEPATVTTLQGYEIMANEIVLATNAPINEGVALHTRQAPYRSYVIGLQIPAGSLPHFLAWDTGEPYYYVRVQPKAAPKGDDILMVGGEDHKSGQTNDTDDRFARLEQWSRTRFPLAGDVLYRWSGQILKSNDALAYLGRRPGGDKHVYVITGDCCNGITNATIGAMIISDLITGVPNRWAECYDPRRVRPRSLTEYIKENVNVVRQYLDWLTPGDVDDIEAIPPGSGAVIRRGVHKFAIYRTSNGDIVQRSAVCTHRRCIVDWNDTEKTWDCPCHGSRFDAYGRVINGPAVEDLDRMP